MKLIDSHCHLDFADFDHDRTQVLLRAKQAGISTCIMPATQRSRWPLLQALARQSLAKQSLTEQSKAHLRSHQNSPSHASIALYPVYGLHPLFLQHHNQADLDALINVLSDPSYAAVGVGECGLDHNKANAVDGTRAVQQFYFQAQVEIARDARLPVVIHARGAVEAVLDTLRNCNSDVGMVHCYNGSYEQARRLIDRGFSLSFGGAITYGRASRLRQLVAKLPLDALLLETDSPDQSAALHKGQRNEPAFLCDVFATVCALRDEPPEQIAQICTANAVNLFSLGAN